MQVDSIKSSLGFKHYKLRPQIGDLGYKEWYIENVIKERISKSEHLTKLLNEAKKDYKKWLFDRIDEWCIFDKERGERTKKRLYPEMTPEEAVYFFTGNG